MERNCEPGSQVVLAARKVGAKYRTHEIGLADASIVVLAERLGVQSVLTLDERHFRALRANGKPMRLLPVDRESYPRIAR